MKAIVTSIYFSLLMVNAHAQDAILKGKITDKNSAPVPSATVSILKAADSSWLRSEISNDEGDFTVSNIPAGEYLLDVSVLGFEQTKQAVTLNPGMNENVVVAVQKKRTVLEEVTVTGKKAFIEAGLGKTVVNVEGSGKGVGSNVLDLMRKLPGISVDMNNNISMAGKQGVLVLINGKETYLSNEQLAEYLKGMSAGDVATMELITQPSAKYDASGNAGIINIKTKKNRKEGFNGSADIEGAVALYPALFGNLLLNYHKNKWNVFAHGNYLNAIGWAKIDRQRNFFDPNTGQQTGYNNSLMESKEHFLDHKLQLGADYNVGDKTTIGLTGMGVHHPNNQETWTDAEIADHAKNTVVYNHAEVFNSFLRTNFVVNGYLKHEFSKESSLDVNLDHVSYGEHTQQATTNEVYDASNNPLPGLELKGDLPFIMKAYSAKADYNASIADIKWEAGLKSGLVTVDNDAAYSVPDNKGNWVPDVVRSNHFVYREHVNAAYINAGKELGKQWQAQAGLRMEQANITGRQYVGSQEFSRSRLSLFPTAYVSYKADDNNQFELNYGRRVERPNYRRLNPFIYFIDQYNYTTGNPDLKPEYTHNMEFKHSYKGMLTTTVRCSQSNDVVNTVVIPDANTKVTYRTDKNVGTMRSAGLSVNFNKELYKWFLLAIASDGWFSEYAGELLDKEIESEGGGFALSIDTQFTFGKWAASAYYNFSMGRQDMLVSARPSQYLSIFVSRKLFHDTCTIQLHMRDPLKLNRLHEYSTFDNTTATADYQWQTQQMALSVNYNFGKNNTKARHEHQSDEMRRMN